ncbi:MAG: aminotransferase class IV [Marinilabiliales bacterium]
MPVEQFICLNGEFIKKKETIFYYNNRSFRYGDGLFETIKVNSKKIYFFQEHYNRLTSGMKLLKFDIPEKWSIKYFHGLIIRLLNINRLFQGARVRLTVFRSYGGFYTPENNNCEFLIEADYYEHEDYVLNSKGLKMGIYTEVLKPINLLSNIKSNNSLIYILAGLYKKANYYDDCFIVNERGNISEAVSSNVFVISGKNIYTPALNEGCVNGIIRNQILDIATALRFIVYEEAVITENDLLKADEIFLTNAISGIKWVVAFKEKRYFCNLSKMFLKQLNIRANSEQDLQEY